LSAFADFLQDTIMKQLLVFHLGNANSIPAGSDCANRTENPLPFWEILAVRVTGNALRDQSPTLGSRLADTSYCIRSL
jgi:hypothetical protein